MATSNHDVLSTAERIGRINNILDTIQEARRICKDAQKKFDRFMREREYLVWANAWQYTQGELDNAALQLVHANTMLTELLTATSDGTDSYRTNFTFQGRWEVGKGGVYGIQFTVTANTIAFEYRDESTIADANSDGGVPTNDDDKIVKERDVIFVSGASESANNGYHVVDDSTPPTDTTITVDTALATELVTTPGAYVELMRRSLGEP